MCQKCNKVTINNEDHRSCEICYKSKPVIDTSQAGITTVYTCSTAAKTVGCLFEDKDVCK
jgi:hypothetical protein